jgi:ubiquinone/menaquinone biosynthesis C-methylase UbiE
VERTPEGMANHKHFLPAAGRDLFLPLYDPLVSWMGFGRAREELIEHANVQPNHHVLDIGCGTGTLAVQLKRQYPAAHVFGLDPDPKALRRAKAKTERAGVSVEFKEGFADELPYERASFDRVFSSFMFHHLEGGDRERALREVLRVLRPGGSFHLVDFIVSDQGGFFHRFINSHAEMKDNSNERLLQLMNRAGFTNEEKVHDSTMLFGLLRAAHYKACHR